MRYLVKYSDNKPAETVEVTFDTLCKFEDEFGISGLQLETNLQLRWLAWCLWKSLADKPQANPMTETYEDWRKRIAEIEPVLGDDINPTTPIA